MRELGCRRAGRGTQPKLDRNAQDAAVGRCVEKLFSFYFSSICTKIEILSSCRHAQDGPWRGSGGSTTTRVRRSDPGAIFGEILESALTLFGEGCTA